MAIGLAGKGFDLDLKEGITQENSLANLLLENGTKLVMYL